MRNKTVPQKVNEATGLLENFKLDGSIITYEDSEEEEVVQGKVVEVAEINNLAPPIPVVMADYEAANEADKPDALSKAINGMKGLTAFDPNDINFFFNQVEIKMQAHGVLKQFTKLQVLTTVLPQNVFSEIKPLLSKKESEFTDNNAYLLVKTEILRIFAPSEEVHFERAMSRVLSDTPSSLARALVNDLCDNQLQGCCCRKFIGGLWKKQLPSNVRSAIADTPFNAANFNAVLKTADNTFNANRSASRVNTSIAMITPVEATPHDTAFSEDFPDGAGIAAYNYGRGGRGGRGQGRGGRGGRGRGQGRGSGNGNRGGQNQNGSARGGGSGGGGGSNGGGQGKPHPRHNTKRHADQPPFESCWRHWTHGKSAHFCMEPATCPWKEFWVPKSNN